MTEQTTEKPERPVRQMWSAICSECNVETKVPFEPQEGRPIYCRDCMRKRRLQGQKEHDARIARLVKSAYIAPKPEATKA